MAEPNKLKAIERRYGRPAAEVVLEKLNEHGSMPEVAKALDLSISTVFRVCDRHGIKKVNIWIKS